ncbi:MAG TPA: pyridoxamine 5'-phosphate oxidase [Leptospiraceae bacterium]|nr:pyridoxamine 5'-phosphate oxidase [Leptospiraceae bacterium]HRG74909.1 pyridoxamine 5'-phosphate oxidase [Leptospiraceae bacterium]
MKQKLTDNPIAHMRRNYTRDGLLEEDLEETAIDQFTNWFTDARKSKIIEPNAMTLATSNKSGLATARIVLLKSFDEKGFIFFTNYKSRKGKEIAETKKGTLLFFWDILERQVRVEGKIKKISVEDSELYFHSRPFESQIGAIASNQSYVLKSRDDLEQKYSELLEAYKGKKVPMPKHWGGYILEPSKIEFWQGRASRLHDRILYTKKNKTWKIERLSP